MKKDNEKGVVDSIIFKDENKIKNNVKMIHKCLDALNANYITIKKYNAYLSHQIAFYLTFYNESHNNNKKDIINNLVKGELNKILNEQNPFNNEEMLTSYFNDLKEKMFYTREQGMLVVNPNSPIKSLKYDLMKFAERFIEFDNDKDEFIINENASLQMMDDLTHKTQNSKQQKVLEILKNINNEIEELKKLGLKNWFTINTNKGRFCTNLRLQDFVRDIKKLK